MELRQLEYFVTVAEEGNFTRAAQRVHITQSGVSAQVKALEQEMGAPLFDRTGRTARLTAAGEVALPYARQALESAAEMRAAIDEVRGLVRGQVTIGMVTGCEVTPLFEALATFRAAHPGIEIELVEDGSSKLVADVRAGVIDLALVGVPGEMPSGLESLVIVSEGLVALVPPGHPIAATGRVPLADLATHPLVTLPDGTGIRAVLDEAMLAAVMIPEVALAASAPGAIIELASRGLGVGVLSASMAIPADLGGRLVAVPIDDVPIDALLGLVWRPAASPALTALLPHLTRAFEAN